MSRLRSTCLFLAAAVGGGGGLQGVGHSKATEASGNVKVAVVESSEELHESLQEKSPLQFGAARTAALTISVDDSVRYQQMDGFGASLTDSSAWLLWNKLRAAQRKEALEIFSYDDLPRGETDPELMKFSIDHDRGPLVPLEMTVVRLRQVESIWTGNVFCCRIGLMRFIRRPDRRGREPVVPIQRNTERSFLGRHDFSARSPGWP